MKRYLSLFCGLAIFATASTTHAQIDWAAGAPGGTSGGSIEVTPDSLVFLETGISAAQIAPTTGNDYTISAWINSSEEGTDESGAPSGNALAGRWWFGTGNQGLHLGVQSTASSLTTGHWSADLSGTTSVAVNTWVHATHVYRGGVQEIYLNGVLDSSLANDAPNFDDTDLQIGARNGTAGPTWGGFIDDVAIFNTALSPAQVTTLFNDSSQAVTLGAAAYYNFEDDQTGTTAANLVDVATSGLIGTDGSPALQQLDGIGAELPPVATWTTGAPGGTSGGAVSFDGEGFFATGIAASLVGGDRNNGSDYTISAWINSSAEDSDDVIDPITGEVTGTVPNGNAANDDWWLGTGNQGLHLGIQNGSTLEQGHWGADTSGTTVVPVNTWVHATYAFDADGGTEGTGEISIYYNGVLEVTADVLGPDMAGTDLRLGSRGRFGASRDFWEGAIDDVAIFTSVLSPAQVTTMFNDSSQAVSLGAVAYFNFEDDQTGSTAANLVDVATSGLTNTAGEASPQVLDRIGAATDVLLGDVNCDGAVNFLDILPFIALISSGEFKAQADVNESGEVDFLDIVPFIAILSGA